MNAPQQVGMESDAEIKMQEALAAQRESYLQEGVVTAQTRIDRIDRAIDVLVRYSDRVSDALNEDFTCRPREVNMLTDVIGSIGAMKHAKKHLKGWMKAEKRPTVFPLNLLGGRSRIEYQPKGVVGIVAPWNFPIAMVFQPMAGILAAGNRTMIKPSEFTPATSAVIQEMIADGFDPSEATVFPGGPEVGQAFSGLPFDHMIFTGATGIARHIMAAASRNLVPVTLELGGKSPVIISRSADIEKSVQRIMLGKTMNAGQICLAPDYLLVPEEKLNEVIEAAQKAVGEMYPTLLDNDQYTSVVNERHYQRLNGYLEEAEQRGQTVIPINPGNEDFSAQNGGFKIPPTLVPEPAEDLALMEEEMFGPILPIRTYRDFEETISYINAKPRPLAAYYFGEDKAEEEAMITRTTSGGVCVNDVIMHIMQEDLPFGGIGPSGMGNYHGLEGFKTFSHAKSVYRQTGVNVAKLGGMLPPYSDTTSKTIKAQLKR
ncbi:coniferyl aldehyde dehydrogenase [Parahalioglobus pacificus]|uniref:Aldehyde dehydrogenase n=1 Tax=Parahalioglobus pacificus TaxID=930806 RepID=A0A918XK13_9GAMM|nr:coniferyl aldehyde dehydrogenase [Halioglobus pacificus]NQY03638.1 coniferyl aldehyde dehydrogenase [Halieaceae bacterium]GHD35452.1 putative coniferyl aldehyde dehydrogenase [Halioglobus pacificus]